MSNKSLQEQIMEKIENLPFSSDIKEGEGTTVHHIWKYNNIKVTDEITNAISDEISWWALDKIVKFAIKNGKHISLDLEDFDFSIDGSEVCSTVSDNTKDSDTVFVTPMLLTILQTAKNSTFQRKREDDSTYPNTLTLNHAGYLIPEDHDQSSVFPEVFFIIADDIEGIIYSRDDIKIKIDSIDVRDTDVTENEDRVELSLKCRMSVSDNVKVLMGE